jgi:hypothetical protein
MNIGFVIDIKKKLPEQIYPLYHQEYQLLDIAGFNGTNIKGNFKRLWSAIKISRRVSDLK